MASKDASDVIYRNDYITRYNNYLTKQQNNVFALFTIIDGSGAANEASEVTYLNIGRTLAPPVDDALPEEVPPVKPPTSTVSTIYRGTPLATLATSNGIFVINGTSNVYDISNGNTITYPDTVRCIAKDMSGNVFVTTSSEIYKNTSSGIVSMNITGLSNISALTVNSNVFFFLQTGSSQIFSGMSNSAAVAVAGSSGGMEDGPGSLAKFLLPRGIALDPSGTFLWVSDTGNSLLRTMSTDSPYTVNIVAGNGIAYFNPNPTDNVGNRDGFGNIGECLLYYPQGITVTPSGSVFIADTNNNNIRLFQNGFLSTRAGRPGTDPVYDISPPGYSDGPTEGALFTMPIHVSYLDSSLYITEPSNGVVRLLTLA